MYTLIVESPAKAKTINKYLGKDFTVLASFGHVRDLPSKDGSVRPDEDFAMDYEVSSDSKKHLSEIAKSVKGSDILYLATDPDREGEAISWHVVEALRSSRRLPKSVEVKRVTFTEITKKAVQHAVANPRDIDMDLVNAQQARRALDYLVGFSISPILWRKLPGARSAGRVQSVALRLICERDAEIERFVSQEYWDVTTQLQSSNGTTLTARLTHWHNEKLEKLSISNEAQAQAIVEGLTGKQVRVQDILPKQKRRNPYAPFTTSTLQMDASRKLGFGAKKTMMVAQKLYEGIDIGGETVGLITYMRTDGVQVSQEAIAQARTLIEEEYGKKYLPEKPKLYSSKAKNAQEAHEAIRPTSLTRTPEKMRHYLDVDQARLYELIWKRMIASQMNPAVYDQMSITFKETGNPAELRASGSVLRFDGFLVLYRQGLDDDQKEEEENQALPPLDSGEMLDITTITPEQHFTEPPPRYTEASLVKRLEELGIGRPSTYAAILSVLQDRGYVELDRKRFVAQMRGRLVSTFLEHYFSQYVEYDFTASLENELDEISDGKREWKEALRAFWEPFIALVNETKELSPRDVLEKLDDILTPFIFGVTDTSEAEKTCPKCGVGKLHLKTGKFGAFLGCDSYPDCRYTKPLDGGQEESAADALMDFPHSLGHHPDTGEEILLKKGPYGIYVEMQEEGKAKRAGLPKQTNAADVMLEQAVNLLALPRTVGTHPETGKVIKAGLGRFGPYLHHDGKYTSLKEDDVLTVGMNRAVTVIAEAAEKAGKRGASAEPLRVLGKHPDDETELAIFKGRYGPYVKYKKINASLPKDAEVESYSLEDALALIAARQGAKKKTTRKAPAKKSKKADDA
ncbi:MAG: type I DNA topoisomerase [Sphaerospermopsis sp. SIO1G2]|nr:type I DNA topoisomerase [Sphaerospermopsis sp. SIO1G2]